jgi:glycosyltransferase involved in cell wall biosynthesis
MLKDTLDSWLGVDQSHLGVELIVVDNNSSDTTAHVVKAFQSRQPAGVRYVFERNPGLSHARNRGIEEAGGRIIAFLDDDIYLDKLWLQEIWRVFDSGKNIHCVGGNSLPVFDADRPGWFTDSMLIMYGSTLSGDTEKYMQYPEHPFGVNMAFRRTVFEQVGVFNARLGRIKKSLLSNEEKELFYRIHQRGLKTFYTPKAIVHHRVPKERLQPEWILKRHFAQGLSKVAFDQITNGKGRVQLLKDALVYFKRAVIGTKPFAIQKTFLFYRKQPMTTRLKNATSLGMSKQSFLEIF